MSHTVHVIRSPQGDPLDADTVATLRALIAERGARRLAIPFGLSMSAIERAAAGARVLRGTRALIAAGIEGMRAAGDLPHVPLTSRRTRR